MDDVIDVAVVEAGEHLFHKHCSVSLGELSFLSDLVEKLATLANSKQRH